MKVSFIEQEARPAAIISTQDGSPVSTSSHKLSPSDASVEILLDHTINKLRCGAMPVIINEFAFQNSKFR